MNEQLDNAKKPAIFQEKNNRLNLVLYFIISAVMLSPFFMLPYLEVKTFVDEDKVTLEQRLAVLPKVMTQLYQDATLIYQDKLPPYQYDQFTWIYSTKSFAVSIPLSELPLNEVQRTILARYQQLGWTMVSNDVTESLIHAQTIRWVKNKCVAEIRYIHSEQPYWYVTSRLKYK